MKKITVGLFFDGTGNNRLVNIPAMTNIGKLSYLYQHNPSQDIHCFYARGVGSKRVGDTDPLEKGTFDWQWKGAAFGDGDWERIDYMLNQINNLLDGYNEAEVTIDVFGYSRGAALARSFVNVILDDSKHQRDNVKRADIKIRFVGLYDTVGSFWQAGNDCDGHNFHLDNEKAQYVFHLTAQDELRANFDLQSIKTHRTHCLSSNMSNQRWMVERRSLGVHSDVGGGYSTKHEHGLANNELARIYLKIMRDTAHDHGIPFKPLTALDEVDSKETIDWQVSEQLYSLFNQIIDYYNDDNKSIYSFHKWLKRAQKHLEAITVRIPQVQRQIKLSTPSHAYAFENLLNYLHKQQQYLKQRITIIKSVMTAKCFDDDTNKANQFLNLWQQFNDNYIHKSHAPFNDTIGMQPQYQSRDYDVPLERNIKRQIDGFQMADNFHRMTFYNPADKTETPFVGKETSLVCYLKFVNKDDNNLTFPSGVEIEVWDANVFSDTKMASSHTDNDGCVTINCFDIAWWPDIYFTFESQEQYYDNGNKLPKYWCSWDKKCVMEDGELTEGRWRFGAGESLGSLANPIIIYV